MSLIQSLKAVPSSLTGGKIVSILLRQAIISKKLRLKQQATVKSVGNPLIYAFGVVPVTSRKQENYVYASDVTEHAVENGSIFSDHIILRPVKIDMVFELSNMEPGLIRYSFNLLVQIRNDRAPFDLLAEHRKIEDVVLTNLNVTHQAPFWNSLEVSASFQQLSIVSLKTTDFPIEKVEYPPEVEGQTRPPDPDFSASIESPTDAGLKIPKIPLVSTAKGIFNSLNL